MYEATKKENLKVKGLGDQIEQVKEEFDEMMRLRNEAKRQLELKFKDVYQKIRDNKQHTIDEGKKVNESLKAYQIKYAKQMSDLNEEMTEVFTTENDYQHSEIKRGNDRMKALEDLLQQEKDDRVQSLNDQLEPINEGIDTGFRDLEDERNARVQKEREILELLQEEANKVEDAITAEQEGRLERQANLTNKLNTELKNQKDRIEQIKTNTRGEFRKDTADMQKEADNRFDHQDRVVKNISHFISKQISL